MKSTNFKGTAPYGENKLSKISEHILYKLTMLGAIGGVLASGVNLESVFRVNCACWSNPVHTDVSWSLVFMQMSIVVLITVVYVGVVGLIDRSSLGAKILVIMLKMMIVYYGLLMVWSVDTILSMRCISSTTELCLGLLFVVAVYGSCLLAIALLLSYFRFEDRKPKVSKNGLLKAPAIVA